MADLVVIVPSAGRPEAVGPLVEAFRATCTANTKLVFSLDVADATLTDYDVADHIVRDNSSMVEALNVAAVGLTAADTDIVRTLGGEPWQAPFALGFMGDDHCPRTVGWDQAYLDALRELGAGMVYGNDLLQGEKIPTQIAMTTDIVRALGYMAPPTLTHLYVDNYWKDLGERAGCLRYLPEVIVEHRHPYAGKANWDEGYLRVNNSDMYQRDEAAYSRHVAEHLAEDVAKVRALRGDA